MQRSVQFLVLFCTATFAVSQTESTVETCESIHCATLKALEKVILSVEGVAGKCDSDPKCLTLSCSLTRNGFPTSLIYRLLPGSRGPYAIGIELFVSGNPVINGTFSENTTVPVSLFGFSGTTEIYITQLSDGVIATVILQLAALPQEIVLNRQTIRMCRTRSCQQDCQIPTSSSTAVMVGSSVCYKCSLILIDPSYVIEWTREKNPLTPGVTTNGVTAFSNGTICIDVAQEHFGQTFVCSTPGGPFTPDFVLSEANLNPPTVSGELTLNETEELMLTCQSTSQPAVTYQWMYGGEVLSDTSTLSVPDITRSSAGVYTCIVTNVIGSLSINSTVIVQYAPSNAISTPSRIPHQTDHTITCSFDSVPTPSIVWSINDTTITSGSGGYTIQNGDSESLLIITNLRPSHQGDYKCEVTNLLGSSSDTANLIVQVPPDPPTGLTVDDTEERSIDISWVQPTFNGHSPLTDTIVSYQRKDMVGDRENTSAGLVTSYEIETLEPNTMYNLYVHAVNSIGTGQPVMITTLTDSLTPARPANLQLMVISSTALKVTWQAPPNDPHRAAIVSWTLEWGREGGGPTEVVIDADDRRFDLTNLNKGTRYFVRLVAFNRAGKGEYSADVIERTAIDPPSSPRDLQAVSINPEEVSLRWLPSSDTGGSPLSKYRVELRRVSAGETSFTNVAEVDHEGNSYILYTIENLIPENSYDVKVSARNMGILTFGPSSEVFNFTTPKLNFPPQPHIPPTYRDLTDTSVVIVIPELEGVITHYIIAYKFERHTWEDGPTVKSPAIPPSNKTYSISGLEPESRYSFRFFTVNTLGESSPSPDNVFRTGPSLSIEVPGNAPVEGSRFSLTCGFAANSRAKLVEETPQNATWLFNGQPITDDLENVEVNGTVLTISDASEDLDGTFTCQYKDAGGAVVTFDTVIDIQPTSQGTSPGLSQQELLIIIVCCGAGGGLILLLCIIMIMIILSCYKCIKNRKEKNCNYYEYPIVEQVDQLQGEVEQVDQLQGEVEQVDQLQGEVEQVDQLQGEVEHIYEEVEPSDCVLKMYQNPSYATVI